MKRILSLCLLVGCSAVGSSRELSGAELNSVRCGSLTSLN